MLFVTSAALGAVPDKPPHPGAHEHSPASTCCCSRWPTRSCSREWKEMMAMRPPPLPPSPPVPPLPSPRSAPRLAERLIRGALSLAVRISGRTDCVVFVGRVSRAGPRRNRPCAHARGGTMAAQCGCRPSHPLRAQPTHLQSPQLPVDSDAEGLEGACCRVTAASAPATPRFPQDGGCDDGCQVVRAVEGCDNPPASNGLRHRHSVRLLPCTRNRRGRVH